MTAKKRQILVTSALPYANGAIHLGHMLEYTQTDIWARFQRCAATSAISPGRTTPTARRSCCGRGPRANRPKS
jgi:hypothetical protein